MTVIKLKICNLLRTCYKLIKKIPSPNPRKNCQSTQSKAISISKIFYCIFDDSTHFFMKNRYWLQMRSMQPGRHFHRMIINKNSNCNGGHYAFFVLSEIIIPWWSGIQKTVIPDSLIGSTFSKKIPVLVKYSIKTPK